MKLDWSPSVAIVSIVAVVVLGVVEWRLGLLSRLCLNR